MIAGILLVLVHRFKLKTHADLKKGALFNDAITICMLLVTVLNILFTNFDGQIQHHGKDSSQKEL